MDVAFKAGGQVIACRSLRWVEHTILKWFPRLSHRLDKRKAPFKMLELSEMMVVP